MRFVIDRPARKAYLFADNKQDVETLYVINSLLAQSLPQNTTRVCTPDVAQEAVTTHLELSDMGAIRGN